MKTKIVSIAQPIIANGNTGNQEKDGIQKVPMIEIEAEFPGGFKAWKQFIEKNINADAPGEGTPPGNYQVIVRFIIDKFGNIADIVSETKHGYGMEEEVIRVLKKSPQWIPANQNGRSVNAYRRQPVTFVVY